MNAFIEPLSSWNEFEEINKVLKDAHNKKGVVEVTGCADAGKCHLFYALGSRTKSRLIVTFNDIRAREIAEEYAFFDENVFVFPAKDLLFYQADIRGNALSRERLLALEAITKASDEGKVCTVVTTFDALMNYMAPPENFKANAISLKTGDELELSEFTKKLVSMGYENDYQAVAPGQFAIRGGIIDVYPMTGDDPVRIELWGDEIDSMRHFEPESQRSIDDDPFEEITVFPAAEWIPDEKTLKLGIEAIKADAKNVSERLRAEMKTKEAFSITELSESVVEELTEFKNFGESEAYISYFVKKPVGLLDYLNKENFIIFLDEPVRLQEQGIAVQTEFMESMTARLEHGYILPGQADAIFEAERTFGGISKFAAVALSTLDRTAKGLTFLKKTTVRMQSVNSYNNSFEGLVKDLNKYKRNNYKTILVSASKTRAKRLADDLTNEGITCFFTEDKDRAPANREVVILSGKAKRGYEYPDIGFVVITDSDIFTSAQRKKKVKRRYEGEHIKDFKDLHPGDYVVHISHGCGIYRGIEKMESDGVLKDYMKIEYAGNSFLYIPATQFEQVEKYAGADADSKPKLNSLGTMEWKRTTARVKKAVEIAAKELVELYAARENGKGYVCGPDTIWQKEFEEMFPYEETPDQIAAIEDTKRDMESPKIMDRLICGDVGFGKTEVAIRAAFKAVQESRQVVYLVPTTILAQQHYNTFAQRMKDFPVRVDLLCRFRTASEQRKTIKDIKSGAVDIVIGTHRVLSKDVEFKNLGLLIIDEEQRFGVRHKEKIKTMRKDVDVLTLTATPIPRTLHMSLIGIRDMSVLEEAPMDRLPIQTYVMEYNEELVREAITRELARDGQVYYVYNRVNTIADVAAKIHSLCPEANVAFAHGQMNEHDLEEIMYQFINKEIDVLVSTTIIETGMDISNVNTMIIEDADNMGLSQLYQLRGRVGRSNRSSYAFFMYRRNKVLKEVAEKRLSAIKEFTDLGSGIKISMKDLEIRGAGNVLGAEQHGHMQAVGYDLYCRMLNEAVKEQKGEEPQEFFETTIDISTDAFIPDKYISNESLKLDAYKRIAAIENEDQQADIIDELIDRYGEPPKSVQELIKIASLKALAHSLYITEIKQKDKTLRFTLYEKAPANPEMIPVIADNFKGSVVFVSDKEHPAFLYKKLQKNAKFDPLEESFTFLEGMKILFD
ncbi:MAG: transcription-repair coupling factor [Lachnospiraceae bacterium]|nr:transcription-repair coupling factor [Lachnospiraceae bacterium]